MLILQRRDLERALTMHDAVDVVGDAFALLSAGRAVAPVRLGLPDQSNAGVLLLMPGLLQGNALAAKLVSVYNNNPARGLPLIHAVVIAFDPETGRPMALLEGTYLTALRTGAASGVATRALARPDVTRAGMIGAGAQALFQLEAVCVVRPITTISVYSRDRERLVAFCARAEERLSRITGRAIRVSPAESAGAAVKDADVVITATTSRTPVLPDSAVANGTHINAVGAYTHEIRELESATVARSHVVVDARNGALAEAGDILIPIQEGLFGADHIKAELGEVIAGTQPGRPDASAVTLFKSVGNAVQDVAVAALAVRRAREQGIGTELDLNV